VNNTEIIAANKREANWVISTLAHCDSDLCILCDCTLTDGQKHHDVNIVQSLLRECKDHVNTMVENLDGWNY
jgi:hypothetical protein